MVGSAIWRNLESNGYTNLIGQSSKELDLRNQAQVEAYFEKEKPEFVFLAAAKVGGILANDTYRAEFIYDNLQIQNNVIHQSYVHGVKKLLFLGSSCIYPKNCPQPMKEEYLLTGELGQTNEPYAIAKIAGIKMCENYNRQYGTNFMSVMPTNLYGPNDNYDLETSHVLPALLRKFHLGKCLEDENWDAIRKDLNKNPINEIDGSSEKNEIIEILNGHGIIYKQSTIKNQQSNIAITLWGSGKPLREFLHVDDLADACTFLFENYNINSKASESSVHQDQEAISKSSVFSAVNNPTLSALWNIGSGEEIAIKDLAKMMKDIVGFQGKIKFDNSKPDGTMRKLLDINRIAELDWAAEICLEDGVKHIYQRYFETVK